MKKGDKIVACRRHSRPKESTFSRYSSSSHFLFFLLFIMFHFHHRHRALTLFGRSATILILTCSV
uniref:Candidate secreted effector n=1 Tax=Meloidogyne incognita TaxID=6306 RepID=A0A914NAU4_MELIC